MSIVRTVKNKKKHYAILLNGNKVGESWAVSAKKAISNYWWKADKFEDKFCRTSYSVDDYDAVEI